MAKREQSGKHRQQRRSARAPNESRQASTSDVRPSPTELLVRVRPDGKLEFVHPRCAAERDDDVRAVQAMIAAGEIEIARDELRWLLQGCSDNLAIHVLLGEIALAEADYPLARGHFGYAYQIGHTALGRASASGRLPAELPPNRAFFAAAKGLVDSLVPLGKQHLADEVARFLLECDSSDPMKLGASVNQLSKKNAGL